MSKNRILSILGAAAITAAVAFAVITFSPEGGGFSSGTIHEGMTYDVCGVAPDALVASVDGNTASADLVLYWIGYNVSYLDSFMQYYAGMALDWDYVLGNGMSVAEYVNEDVLASVKQHLVLENMAEKYGATLTDEQSAAMEQSVQSDIEQLGGEEAYDAELAKLGLRRETYARAVRTNYLYQNLLTLYLTEGSPLYVSNEELALYAAQNGYITADHILLATQDTATGEALSEEEIAAKKALAEELAEKLNSYTGEDLSAYFASLADEYSEDPGRASYPAGYTFTTGSMVQEFEDAAYALAEGEVSGIVESQFGYHILLRLPLDESAAADSVREEYFSNLISQEVEAAQIRTSSLYSALDARALYEAIQAAQAAG